jgi:ribose-phosphate pyrophosphokinase
LAKSLCRNFALAGLNKLITFDCHFLNQTGLLEYEGLQIQNISLGTDLIEKAKTIFNGEKFEIIGPDEGSRYLVEGHGGKNLKKVRKEYAAKKVSYRDVHEITGDLDVKGKNVLILDDMISSGSTMVKALEKLTEAGAKNIACAATHGLFLFDCLDKMRQFTRHIISSDTILNSQAEVSIKQHLTNL